MVRAVHDGDYELRHNVARDTEEGRGNPPKA
jgi:hypothetical protein